MLNLSDNNLGGTITDDIAEFTGPLGTRRGSAGALCVKVLTDIGLAGSGDPGGKSREP